MIITIGESVYDILLRDNIPFSAVYGGSMFNVSVSLGRSFVQCAFAGFHADDFVGFQSKHFLELNNVDTKFFSGKPLAKSNLALAFLNDLGVPQYSFYRDNKLMECPTIEEFNGVTHLVCGSFFVLNDSVFYGIQSIIEKARSKHVQVLYDPNIRQRKVYKDEKLIERIIYLMQNADLVKMSDEDIISISGSETLDDWHSFMKNLGVKHYIITQGSDSVIGFENGKKSAYSVNPLRVKSTVGAGDAFNAGVVYASVKFGVPIVSLDAVVSYGISFAANVCLSDENYISKQFLISE